MCLCGVDYFSTLGYQPSIAFEGAGTLAPLATLVLVLVTLFGAYPVYSYVAGLTSADTGAPVIMTPLIPGTTRFDPKPFGGKALVVFIGTSSTPIPIEPDGRVLVNGRDLFDPAQPYWRGIPPDLKWPE